MKPRDAVQSAISSRFGLFPRDGWRAAIEQAAADMEGSTKLGADTVLRQATTDAALLKLLAGKVTVSESFFFRHPEQLDLAVSHIEKRVGEGGAVGARVWSAGCSGGEEPLSMAMLLAETLSPFLLSRVSIVGNDIDADAIASARSGHFSSWSFRGLSETRRRHYFTSAADGRFHLAEHVRKMVAFEHRSIQEQLTLTPPQSIDVLMFRNVGIYLTPECLESLHSGFHLVLKEGGLLCTAPSDPPIAHPGFERVDAQHGAVYRKTISAPKKDEGFRWIPRRPVACDSPTSLEGSSSSDNGIGNQADLTRGYIAEGQAALDEQDYDSAEAVLRRAVFSDPVDPEARYWYALALLEAGSPRRSRAQLNAILSSLSSADPAQKLHDGESTVGDLHGSIRLLLQKLEGRNDD